MQEAFDGDPTPFTHDMAKMSSDATQPRTTLLAQTEQNIGDPTRDIGNIVSALQLTTEIQLTSINQIILKNIVETIREAVIKRKQLKFAPAWIVEETLREEYDLNRKDSSIQVTDHSISRQANVITYNVIYKIKL